MDLKIFDNNSILHFDIIRLIKNDNIVNAYYMGYLGTENAERYVFELEGGETITIYTDKNDLDKLYPQVVFVKYICNKKCSIGLILRKSFLELVLAFTE